MSTLVSEYYRNLNNALHSRISSYGTGGWRWAPVVNVMADVARCRTVLDYGCGKQTLQLALPNLKITGYDPAISELSALPRSHDLVVCTDVLEHIEPAYLQNVLNDLVRVVNTVGLVVVSTRPAKKMLDDGRNAHLIQQSPADWITCLEKRFNVLFVQFSERHSELVLLVAPQPRLRPLRYIVGKLRAPKLSGSMGRIKELVMKVWEMPCNGFPKAAE
jgi:hypothetical protein